MLQVLFVLLLMELTAHTNAKMFAQVVSGPIQMFTDVMYVHQLVLLVSRLPIVLSAILHQSSTITSVWDIATLPSLLTIQLN